MAISRVKTWSAGEVLTAADLNAEFNNILDNALSLISPLTGTLDVNNQQLSNLRLENRTADPTPANIGRIWYRTDRTVVRVDTGSRIFDLPGVLNPLEAQVFS